MRNFLLLLLSLITGLCSEVKVCSDGWLTFTCKYPKIQGIIESFHLVNPRKTLKLNSEVFSWERRGRYSLFHDPQKKDLQVSIRPLHLEDFGTHRCQFYQKTRKVKEVKLEFVSDKSCCQSPVNQTAYRSAPTSISCPGLTFFCKDHEGSPVCEDVVSTESQRSNGSFALTETAVSIGNVSSRHAGVYWCGRRGAAGKDARYRAASRRIQLEVKDIINFRRSPAIGQKLTFWCRYPENTPMKKFICRGEDPSDCDVMVSTAERPNGRFSMQDDPKRRNISITVRDVREEDAGTYWCGAESTGNNPFFHRLVMTVGSLQVLLTVAVCGVLLLLFVLLGILIYRRKTGHSKNKRNAAAVQHIKEECSYEEIQEQNRDPGQEVNTIYVTADFPTIPSGSLHYSTIDFGAAGAPVTRPPSSTCDVKEAPLYSTVSRPPSSTCDVKEAPLYSTVSRPPSSTSDVKEAPLYSTVSRPPSSTSDVKEAPLYSMVSRPPSSTSDVKEAPLYSMVSRPPSSTCDVKEAPLYSMVSRPPSSTCDVKEAPLYSMVSRPPSSTCDVKEAPLYSMVSRPPSSTCDVKEAPLYSTVSRPPSSTCDVKEAPLYSTVSRPPSSTCDVKEAPLYSTVSRPPSSTCDVKEAPLYSMVSRPPSSTSGV
ncbi:uncharacterized protein LOC117731292 isoform X3 [Cyclopterus lumpus]|uniref:uncharacterized protein LOC117731292 isoform X3 n=1 Tax=Cyclopterus lumpus TaxID=8103 RepID=UPI0014861BC8|nr:uncharacterized protein LOC117731292 isoform X3 [Cyclopterus lumpus]